MDDASRMSRRQRADDLGRDIEGIANRQLRSRHSPAQRGAFDIFGGDEMPAIHLADLEDCDNVRMIERRGGLGLLLEAAKPLRVFRVAFGKELDCDFAIEPGVLRQINFTHSPGTDWGDDLISIKTSSCGDGHNVYLDEKRHDSSRLHWGAQEDRLVRSAFDAGTECSANQTRFPSGVTNPMAYSAPLTSIARGISSKAMDRVCVCGSILKMWPSVTTIAGSDSFARDSQVEIVPTSDSDMPSPSTWIMTTTNPNAVVRRLAGTRLTSTALTGPLLTKTSVMPIKMLARKTGLLDDTSAIIVGIAASAELPAQTQKKAPRTRFARRSAMTPPAIVP